MFMWYRGLKIVFKDNSGFDVIGIETGGEKKVLAIGARIGVEK